MNSNRKKCVAILLVSIILCSFIGCSKSEDQKNTKASSKQSGAAQGKFSKEEVESAAKELFKQLHNKGDNDSKKFASLFINTKEDTINQLYKSDLKTIDMYDGLHVDVYGIDGNKALVSELLYIVTGTGSNTHHNCNYKHYCISYSDGKWRFDNSDALVSWASDLLIKTCYSKEAQVIPSNKKWHNNNPLTMNNFVIPRAYLVEPVELYYKDDGSLEFTIMASNGMDKNIFIKAFSDCVFKDAKGKVIFDASESRIDKPLKAGKGMLINLTIPAEKVCKDADLSSIKWSLGTMYD